jgi:hypothetical protein
MESWNQQSSHSGYVFCKKNDAASINKELIIAKSFEFFGLDRNLIVSQLEYIEDKKSFISFIRPAE